MFAEDPEIPINSNIDTIKYQIGKNGAWITIPIVDDPIVRFTIPLKGPYNISYHSIDAAGNPEEIKSINVIVNASKLTYHGEFKGTYSDPVLLKAFLLDMAWQKPIEGKTIEFTVGNQPTTAETLSDGFATTTLYLDQPGGAYIIAAIFEEDGEYLASSDEHPFIINKEHAYAEYTGDMVVPLNADYITLRATVFDDDDGNWGDLTKINVTITILDSVTILTLASHTYNALQVETTHVFGVGVALITIDNPFTLEGEYLVQISFEPNENHYYHGDPSMPVALIIYEPVGDFVTGGGWIEDANGNKGNFGFNVKYKKNGLPKGQAIFVYKEGEYTVIVKANAWVGMAIISEDNYTIFEAKCNVKKVDCSTGEIIWEEGNYRLIIEAWDHSKDGKGDVIQIRVLDKIGLIFYESGFDPYGHLLGGNIVIHIDKKE